MPPMGDKGAGKGFGDVHEFVNEGAILILVALAVKAFRNDLNDVVRRDV